MPYPQKHPLRALTEQEERALSQIAKASSERVDTVRRAKAVLAVHAGAPFTMAAGLSGFKSADSVSQLVERFNQQGLGALSIAAGRGRKPTYTSSQRQHILEHLRSTPDREQDQSATWSLRLLQRALRRHLLPRIGASTMRRILHKAGYVFGRSRTWCRTGTAIRVRKAGVVTVHDPQAQEKQRLIELAYRIAEAAGVELWCQDEAGPYQAIPQPGEDWHLQEYPRRLPHEYARGGTAKLLTLFRPATGQVRAKGVLSAPNAVLHPWLKEELTQVVKPILLREAELGRPLESERPVGARWRTWLWPHENDEGLPPLRILLVWDNLAGHLSHDLLPWLFHNGIMPLSLYAFGRVMAQYGRVGAAHHCAPCSRWAASPAGTRADRLARANRRRLECRSQPFCLGRQTPTAARARPPATTRWVGSRSFEGLLNCGVTH